MTGDLASIDIMNNPIWIFVTSFFGAFGPMAMYTSLVWWMDRYEREPIRLLAFLFLCGAVPCAGVALCAHFVLSFLATHSLPLLINETVSVVVLAPLIEESIKLLPILLIRNHKDFNNPTDGIVYGSAVGFGFGMTENLFYFLDSFYTWGPFNWLWTMVVRTVFTGMLHAFSTGFAGYLIGRAKYHHVKQGIAAGAGLAVAILFHMIWNSVMFFAGSLELSQYLYFFFGCFPAVIAVMFLLMQLSLFEESVIIREELAAEAATGLISTRQLSIIPYYHKRISKHWISPVIKRDFLNCATKLAFKKRELRYMNSMELDLARGEIEELRDRLRALSRDSGT